MKGTKIGDETFKIYLSDILFEGFHFVVNYFVVCSVLTYACKLLLVHTLTFVICA